MGDTAHRILGRKPLNSGWFFWSIAPWQGNSLEPTPWRQAPVEETKNLGHGCMPPWAVRVTRGIIYEGGVVRTTYGSTESRPTDVTFLQWFMFELRELVETRFSGRIPLGLHWARRGMTWCGFREVAGAFGKWSSDLIGDSQELVPPTTASSARSKNLSQEVSATWARSGSFDR